MRAKSSAAQTQYYYDDASQGESKRKETGKIEKGVKRLLIIAAVIFIAQLIWLFGISPFIPFSNVEIQGFSGLGRAEILLIAGIDENTSYISANAKNIQDKLSANLLVESAVVMKRYPDRLSIFLTPREAVAVSLVSAGSKQVPFYVDRHGVFFKVGTPGSIDAIDLPIISGIENLTLGMRFPSSLLYLTENLRELSINAPHLLSAISEIRIEEKIWEGYDLVIYPVHSSIKVRIENNFNEETLRYMLLMLNVFESESHTAGAAQKPKEIDFRSTMGTYRLKEQS